MQPLVAQNRGAEAEYVNHLYNAMSDDERLGQLMMIRAHSNLGEDHVAKVDSLIQQFHVGSLCFFQGTPEKQAELTNRYQQLSKIPLLVAMDAEWGLSMRLKETCITFPKQLMLGAIQDDKLIYYFGKIVAKECKRLGVHINFAPVADVNNNPNNPVINERSFGEDKYNVATKCFMYMRGMQDNGLMACAKHFPGHGDTDADSHFDLPLIKHDMARLRNTELLPFRILTDGGVQSMMAAHLQIPAIDDTEHLPTSLSKKAVTEILRNEIGFKGIIFTDGLEMKGVTKYYTGGEVEARSIAAGNDILCLPENVGDAFLKIKQYIQAGKINPAEVEKSVKRVLAAKYRLGLTTKPTIETNHIRADIQSEEALALKKQLIEAALTLVRNEDKIVPINAEKGVKMATVSIGSATMTDFQKQILELSPAMPQYRIGKRANSEEQKDLLDKLKDVETVVVSLHDMVPQAAKQFGLNDTVRAIVSQLGATKKVILVVFGNPYSLKYFDNIANLLECYNEDPMTQQAAANALFGKFVLKGKLPITASPKSKFGDGAMIQPKHLPKTLNMESIGLDANKLKKIDSIAQELIANGAAPSCQILVAKNGQVAYHKAFGHHTYEQIEPAKTEDLYDLASITKVAATTICLMRLHETGQIDLNKKVSDYLPRLKGSNKEHILLKNLLIHQAGLKPWIPFYKATLENNKWSTLYYNEIKNGQFNVPVAKNLYMNESYIDTIFQKIVASPLEPTTEYKYSDLGLILMTELIYKITGKTLDVFVSENFYKPLGMNSTLFNPLTRFSENKIAPTEEDTYFRMQRLCGSVHDMGAAMLGGVSGHAGLFSNTADLAILFQMLLNGGVYEGVRFFKPETIALFTSRQGGSTRRGYGWDMKETDTKKTLNMSASAPVSTYGHTGFTGNAVYADPDNQLIYIFLSNRTYPNADNDKLLKGDYRPRIQTAIYEAMRKNLD
jgi:beta-glucosidase-like glycosyl hydrolase/CubicO group peptidase (beta-lactamase class C family)